MASIFCAIITQFDKAPIANELQRKSARRQFLRKSKTDCGDFCRASWLGWQCSRNALGDLSVDPRRGARIARTSDHNLLPIGSVNTAETLHRFSGRQSRSHSRMEMPCRNMTEKVVLRGRGPLKNASRTNPSSADTTQRARNAHKADKSSQNLASIALRLRERARRIGVQPSPKGTGGGGRVSPSKRLPTQVRCSICRCATPVECDDRNSVLLVRTVGLEPTRPFRASGF